MGRTNDGFQALLVVPPPFKMEKLAGPKCKCGQHGHCEASTSTLYTCAKVKCTWDRECSKRGGPGCTCGRHGHCEEAPASTGLCLSRKCTWDSECSQTGGGRRALRGNA